jgi:DHA2 family multidrug resistance protein-like MFS transporter
MASGLALSALGSAVLAAAATQGLWGLIAGSVIYSVGLSPVVILATDLIVGAAPVERAGAASAISETGSELGGALGIALLGSLATAIYRGAMATSMPAGVPTGTMQVARGTLGSAVEAAKGARPPAGSRTRRGRARGVHAGVSGDRTGVCWSRPGCSDRGCAGAQGGRATTGGSESGGVKER